MVRDGAVLATVPAAVAAPLVPDNTANTHTYKESLTT
jgi:hypothetical protein